jgi:ATP-dependent Clp protease, protease subunit
MPAVPVVPATEDSGSLKDNGVYLLMEDISASSCKGVIEWILEENFKKERKDHLNLIINSPGGDCSACFALLDVMRGSKIPVHTTGLGCIASCGFIIFIAGAKGHRVLTPNTSILSHQYSWSSWGKHHDLVADRVEQDLTHERILNHYKKCLGISKKIIEEKLLPAKDVWLTHKQCIEYNICDVVKDL